MAAPAHEDMTFIEGLLHNTTFWVALSFVIFAVVAYRFAKDMVVNALDGKIKEIKNNIEGAENLRVEAQELLAQYQRKHRDAVLDAETIVQNAKLQAEEVKKNVESEAQAVLELRQHQLEDRLKRIKENAMADLRQEITDKASEATLKILLERLNKKENTRLVNETIEELPTHLKKAS